MTYEIQWQAFHITNCPKSTNWVSGSVQHGEAVADENVCDQDFFDTLEEAKEAALSVFDSEVASENWRVFTVIVGSYDDEGKWTTKYKVSTGA